MSIEIVKSIKQTETEAEQTRKQSVLEAREVVSQAKNQAYILMEQEIEKAENEAKGIISEAEKTAYSQIEEMKQKVSQECNEIKQQAMKKIDDAVNVIMGRVVKTHGSS